MGIERLGGAHFLQLSGQPYDHQTHIADHRQEHLAQRLGLAGFEALFGPQSAGNPNSPRLAQAARQPAPASAPKSFSRRRPAPACLASSSGCSTAPITLVIGIESAHDFRHIQSGAQYAQAGVGQIEGARRCKGGAQPLARRDPG